MLPLLLQSFQKYVNVLFVVIFKQNIRFTWWKFIFRILAPHCKSAVLSKTDLQIITCDYAAVDPILLTALQYRLVVTFIEYGWLHFAIYYNIVVFSR